MILLVNKINKIEFINKKILKYILGFFSFIPFTLIFFLLTIFDSGEIILFVSIIGLLTFFVFAYVKNKKEHVLLGLIFGLLTAISLFVGFGCAWTRYSPNKSIECKILSLTPPGWVYNF